MSENKFNKYESLSELIADPNNPTPIVRLGNINKNQNFPIYLKLEWVNPFGSVKDRTAKFLLDGLLKSGKLKKGKKLVEPSSGNTGIALVALANLLGYKTTITKAP